MKHQLRLAALAVLTVAGLAPAMALSPALAAPITATAGSPARLWVMHQYVTRAGFNLKVAASPDGSAVFVAGAILKVNHKGTNASVTALNPTTGATLWRTQYTASPNSGFSHVAVSPDGSTVFAAAGAEPVGGGASNALVVAFSAATGAILWTAGAGFVAPVDGLAVAPDGSAVFTTGAAGTVPTTRPPARRCGRRRAATPLPRHRTAPPSMWRARRRSLCSARRS